MGIAARCGLWAPHRRSRREISPKMAIFPRPARKIALGPRRISSLDPLPPLHNPSTIPYNPSTFPYNPSTILHNPSTICPFGRQLDAEKSFHAQGTYRLHARSAPRRNRAGHQRHQRNSPHRQQIRGRVQRLHPIQRGSQRTPHQHR